MGILDLYWSLQNLVSKIPILYDVGLFVIHYPNHENRVKSILPLISDGMILEIGCGTGKSYEFIKQHVRKIVHIDINMNSLKKAKQRGLTNLYLADGYYLPFKHNSFDQVLLIGTMHHIFDHVKLFEEIYRVLKKSGTILIYEPNNMGSSKAVWGVGVDGKIWNYNPQALRTKILVDSKKRFEELSFEVVKSPSLVYSLFNWRESVILLKKVKITSSKDL